MKNIWRKLFPLSATAISIIWLLENDRDGWIRNNYGAVHLKSCNGVWLASEYYGLCLYHSIPPDDAKNIYLLTGVKMKLNSRDRKAIWKLFQNKHFYCVNPITKSIHRFAMLKDYKDV